MWTFAGDKNRHYGDVKALDTQVEEAVKRLTQGNIRDSSANTKILRNRRFKSLPGGRSYDWNSAHFFPDQHDVNVALTFQVPSKKSFEGDEYCRDSASTFISVSREEPSGSRDETSRDWKFDNNMNNYKNDTINNNDDDDVVDSYDEERFKKVWQRSPVRRGRDGRPSSTKMATAGLPPKGSIQVRSTGMSVTTGENIEQRSMSTQAGSPKLLEIRTTKNQFPSRQKDHYHHRPDEIKYSEVKINKFKTLSLENLDIIDRENSNFKSTPDHQHGNNYYHRKLTSPSIKTHPDNSLKRSINLSPIDFNQSIKFNSIGSDESSVDYKVCEEEDKLRCQGYEIDSMGIHGINNADDVINNINIPPADDYVYVLKKVLRRPRSSVDQRILYPVKEAFNRQKEVKVKSRIDFMPEQRFIISKPESGAPYINRYYNDDVNINPFMEGTYFKNNQTKQKPRVTFSPGRESIKIYQKMSPDELMRVTPNQTTKSFHQKRCVYKPPKAPKDASKSFAVSYPGLLNHSLDQKIVGANQKSFLDQKRLNPPKQKSSNNHDHQDSNGFNSTVFGLTGHLNRRYDEANKVCNQRLPSISPTHDFTDKSSNLSSGKSRRHFDSRRQTVSGWLELGSDLEHDLMMPGGSNVDGSIRPLHYHFTPSQEGRQNEFNESNLMIHFNGHQSDNHENKDGVGLIFDAIGRQNNYLNQSDSFRRSSVSEAIYVKPNKLETPYKTQDRFDDLIYLDLHTKPKLDQKLEDHPKMSKKAVRPTSFTQTLKSCNTSNENVNIIKPIRNKQSIGISSYSLPGSRENIRQDSKERSEENYEQFSVAEIKAKLFGPNEEKANSLLIKNRRAIGKLHSKNRTSQNIYDDSHVSKNSSKNYFTPQERCEYFRESDSSSSNVEEHEHPSNKFTHKLKLKEIPDDICGSLGARKDLDDMASRKYKILNKWNARSNPDLSQKEKSNSKIQTTYPRKTSRTTSREKLSRTSDKNAKECEIRTTNNLKYLRSNDCQYKTNNSNSSNTSSKSYLTRRQSLCAGVAKLVNLFEKSRSAPDLLEENLFSNSYSEAGDPLVDQEDVVAMTTKQNKNTPKQSGSKYKKNKKVKVRLLKSSDSGYIESETDSMTSSGKDCKEKITHTTKDTESTGSMERYDKEKRQQDLKQMKHDWLNSSSSPTNKFVSKKEFSLNKINDDFMRQDSSGYIAPNHGRNCEITSFGQSHLSAFDRVTRTSHPILKKTVNKQETIEDNRAVKNGPFEGSMSLLTKKVINVPTINKAEPILASKYPSGFLPQPIRKTFEKDYLAPPTRQKFFSEKFELSDDGNLTDCTDGTIDAILAHNQLCTLSPTSTLDCSDFEIYQANFPPRHVNRNSVIKSESTLVSQPVVKPPQNVSIRKEQPREREKRSIKELVDTFEVLLTNPFVGPTKYY